LTNEAIELQTSTYKVGAVRPQMGAAAVSLIKLKSYAATVAAVAILSSSAEAQQQPQPPKITLSSLIAQGFEIKAGNVVANTSFIGGGVILQKGKDVFWCYDSAAITICSAFK
jgi:hypothetical protein